MPSGSVETGILKTVDVSVGTTEHNNGVSSNDWLHRVKGDAA